MQTITQHLSVAGGDQAGYGEESDAVHKETVSASHGASRLFFSSNSSPIFPERIKEAAESLAAF